MSNAPCFECPDRCVGCHSTCEKYQAFDEARKELREKRFKAKKIESDYWETSRNYRSGKQ